MAAGLQALKDLGVSVSEYHAWEIDESCRSVALANHPEIIQHGTVEGADFSKFGEVDLLLGGSPCQGFSALGRGQGLEDPRSRLFWEFVRARKEARPRDILLENVRMNAEARVTISSALGIIPVEINSALVSAQRRRRLYWTTLDVAQPADRGLVWGDVWDRSFTEPNSEGYHRWFARNREQQTSKQYSQVLQPGDKAKTFTASSVKSWESSVVPLGNERFRFMTPEEAEGLQTLPRGYTSAAKRMERYKMIGNGWTLEVIKHILSALPEARR